MIGSTKLILAASLFAVTPAMADAGGGGGDREPAGGAYNSTYSASQRGDSRPLSVTAVPRNRAAVDRRGDPEATGSLVRRAPQRR